MLGGWGAGAQARVAPSSTRHRPLPHGIDLLCRGNPFIHIPCLGPRPWYRTTPHCGLPSQGGRTATSPVAASGDGPGKEERAVRAARHTFVDAAAVLSPVPY